MCEKQESYISRTDKQLKKLAMNWVTGQIFTSDQVDGRIELQLVFMPLIFMEPEDINWCKENQITLLWAPVEKALPRSINGMPVFMVVHFLNQEDHKKFVNLAEQMDQAMMNCEVRGGKIDG